MRFTSLTTSYSFTQDKVWTPAFAGVTSSNAPLLLANTTKLRALQNQ